MIGLVNILYIAVSRVCFLPVAILSSIVTAPGDDVWLQTSNKRTK